MHTYFRSRGHNPLATCHLPPAACHVWHSLILKALPPCHVWQAQRMARAGELPHCARNPQFPRPSRGEGADQPRPQKRPRCPQSHQQHRCHEQLRRPHFEFFHSFAPRPFGQKSRPPRRSHSPQPSLPDDPIPYLPRTMSARGLCPLPPSPRAAFPASASGRHSPHSCRARTSEPAKPLGRCRSQRGSNQPAIPAQSPRSKCQATRPPDCSQLPRAHHRQSHGLSPAARSPSAAIDPQYSGRAAPESCIPAMCRLRRKSRASPHRCPAQLSHQVE